MSAAHHPVFTDRMPFLPPNQQRQSTEGTVSLAVSIPGPHSSSSRYNRVEELETTQTTNHNQ